MASAAASQWRRYPKQVLASLRCAERDALAHLHDPTRDQPLARCTTPAPWSTGDLAAQWLGHATVLLDVTAAGAAPLRILTDPVLSDRVGPRLARRTIGVARRTPAPAFDPDRLGVVLLSHAHFDHLDRPSLTTLARPDTVVITARGTRRLIPKGFARVIELDWHESVDVRGVTFTAYRPRHWGARTLWDRHRGYNSYLIESARLPASTPGPASGKAVSRVFFAGDTAFTNAFDGIEATLAIFGIGAYEPWIHAHANPEQVWAMFTAMRADFLMPIHHETFQLGDEAPDEPMARLIAAAGANTARITCVSELLRDQTVALRTKTDLPPET